MARPRAPESNTTSTSTVGLPRESRTSRPTMCSMVLTTVVLLALRRSVAGGPAAARDSGGGWDSRDGTGGRRRPGPRQSRTPDGHRRPSAATRLPAVSTTGGCVNRWSPMYGHLLPRPCDLPVDPSSVPRSRPTQVHPHTLKGAPRSHEAHHPHLRL